MAGGDCKESSVLRDQLLQDVVGRTPKVSPSSIAMSTNIEFLRDQLIGKDGEKLLLILDTEIQEVMYKFKSFTNPTLMILNSSEWVGVVLLTGYANCEEQLVGHLCRKTYILAKEIRETKCLFSKCQRLALAQGLTWFKECNQVVIYKMSGSCSTM